MGQVVSQDDSPPEQPRSHQQAFVTLLVTLLVIKVLLADMPGPHTMMP